MNSRMSLVVILLALCLINAHSSPDGSLKTNDNLDLCKLPPETGPCRAAFPRWYYKSSVNKCFEFIYGGCQGNGNNFDTENNCTETCKPSVVTQKEDHVEDKQESKAEDPKDSDSSKLKNSSPSSEDHVEDKPESKAEDPKDSDSSKLKNSSPSSEDHVEDKQESKAEDPEYSDSYKPKNSPSSEDHLEDKQESKAEDPKDSDSSKLKNSSPSSKHSVDVIQGSEAEDPKDSESSRLKNPTFSSEDRVDDELQYPKAGESSMPKNPSSWSEYHVEEDQDYLDDLDDNYSQNYWNDSAVYRGSDPLEHKSSHFAAFILSSIFLVLAAYAIYRNRQKIIVIIRAGRNYGDSRRHGYMKLETNVEASTFVY